MRWLDRAAIGRIFGYALLTAVATVVLIVALAIVNAIYFNDPNVKVTNLDGAKLAMTVCPGQTLEVHTRVTIQRPIILFSYFSVMDEGMNHNFNGTQISNGARPHPHAASFTQTLNWLVPDLAPGTYSRVLAFRGTDGRENSIFSATKFEIGENC